MSGDQNAQDDSGQKPPRRDWYPFYRGFYDLQFSHYVQIALTIALIILAGMQWVVISRQTRIMATQAHLAEAANKLNVAMQRACVIVDNVKVVRVADKEPGNPS